MAANYEKPLGDGPMRIDRRRLLSQVCCTALVGFSQSREAQADAVTYTYDELGRVRTVTYGNGATITYAYDPAGNRTTLTQAVGSPTPAGSLSANPGSIMQGNSSSLSWSSSNATSAAIDSGVGPVTPVAGGSVSVSPSATTTYTLTLTGPGGQTNKQATVTVIGLPTGTFSANPTSIGPAGSSTLSWTSANAASASIDNGIGSVTPVSGGSVQVSPSANTTYTLTLTGPGGQTTRQATVTVSANQTIQITGSGPVNLRTLANAAGYNGAQAANFTFEASTLIVGTPGSPNGGIAIDTGVWPSGYPINLSLILKSGCIVRGGGGRGSNGADGYSGPGAGGAGGDGVYCRVPIAITVEANAALQAGGGGGRGGVHGWYQPSEVVIGGGGGGGGAPNGPGGSGGGVEAPGSPGAGGTPTGGGAGGYGGSYEGAWGGTGGSGGNLGAAGSGPGGAAGYAIRKNGHAVSVVNNGTIVGAQG